MYNRKDLIALSGYKIKNSSKLELTKADLTRVVDAVVTSITNLAYDEGIRIAGLGTFKMKRQAARKGIAPIGGKAWVTEEKDVLRFKAGKRKI